MYIFFHPLPDFHPSCSECVTLKTLSGKIRGDWPSLVKGGATDLTLIFFEDYTKNNACKSCGLTDGSSFQDIKLIRLLGFPKLGTAVDRARPGLAFQNKCSLQNIKAPTSSKLLETNAFL